MLYGRDAERAEIGALLEAARSSRSGALVLRGEPGIGKSALLEDARGRASDMRVLSARGVESEAELPFAGLHQLLRPALKLVDRLPGPQAAALEGALGVGDRGAGERFLVSVACLTLLSELAEAGPVLCLVDDVQWLDRPSSDALVFVARRLDAEGIVILFAAREGDVRRFEGPGLAELDLAGLDADAATALIEQGAEGAVALGAREFLLKQAAGNALALVELPSTLTAGQLAGSEPLPDEVPLTREIELVFLQRVRRLPEATQRLLQLLAADDSGRLGPVIRAGEALGIDAGALGPAEEAGLVSVQGQTVEMRHPLVRSAVYQASASSERRAAHLALADALSEEAEPDQRAWHRAAAASGSDEEVAAGLERTAERARLRSGHSAAAAALERAAELSEDVQSKARRLVAAAGDAWQGGQPDRAIVLLDRAGPLLADDGLRAEEAHIRGLVELRRGALLDAGPILMSGAALVAESDPRKALEMLVDAGSVAGRSGDSVRMGEIARQIAALPRTGDEIEGLLADLLVGVGSLIEGKSSEEAGRVVEAVSRAADFDDPRLLSWAATGASVIGDEAAEATLLRRAMGVARASGDVDTLVLVLETFVSSAQLSGRFTYTAEAAEGLSLSRQAGLPNVADAHLAALAWLAALKGDEEDCRSYAAEINGRVRRSGMANANSIATWGEAMLDLSIGRPHETIARLVELSGGGLGVLHPFFVLMFTPDLVEACVRSDRREEGRAMFGALDAFARSGAPTWAFAHAARCRGLLSEDARETEQQLSDAIRAYDLSNRPFDTARTQLMLGEHLRRARRRMDAREHLRAALNVFESLGAEPWIERARAELRASGETARKRDPTVIDQLTPQELQIARVVAEGLTNKEVAAQLFLSPRTIDAHLRNIFGKLGLTSRTQLARLPLDGQEAPAVSLA